MIFTKNRMLSLATMFIIMAVYNVVVFVIPFSRGGGFWTGYGFTMLAMILTTSLGFYAFDRRSLRSKVYGVPFLFVVRWYIIIQVIVGLLQMILTFIPAQYMIAANIIILGAFLIGVIIVEVGKDEIERIDKKVKEKVFYIKSLQVDVEGMVHKTSDGTVKKVLKDLAETIRYSDSMSSLQLAAIENKIESKFAALAETVENANGDASKALCDELQQLFAERNRKCKILK